MNINTNVNEIFFNNSYKSKLWIISLLNTIVSFDQQSKAKRLYKLLKKNLLTLRNNNKTNNNFLDYGFGRGSLLLKIPSKHVNIYGCELSLEAIKNMMRLDRIIKRGINIFYINKSEEIFSKIKFDFITCSHVLEHCENDTELLRQFYDLSIVGGKLLLNVPINEVWQDPKHIRKYSQESLVHILRKIGFHIEECFEADRWTAFILFNEKRTQSHIIKIALRLLRFIFALIPISILDFTENVLPSHYQYQQLIIVANKS